MRPKKDGLAGAMDAVGIGEATIAGIKKYIIAKIEQNSVNIRPIFRTFTGAICLCCLVMF